MDISPESQEDNKKLLKRKYNKTYYDKHKTEVINYIVGYNANRRKTDAEYRAKINEYIRLHHKNNYDDVARQKKREYYLKKKQQTQQDQ